MEERDRKSELCVPRRGMRTFPPPAGLHVVTSRWRCCSASILTPGLSTVGSQVPTHRCLPVLRWEYLLYVAKLSLVCSLRAQTWEPADPMDCIYPLKRQCDFG